MVSLIAAKACFFCLDTKETKEVDFLLHAPNIKMLASIIKVVVFIGLVL